MADYTETTRNCKVYRCQGGDVYVVSSGGTLALGASVNVSVSGTNVIITGLPTSDPGIAGALWADSKVLKLSAS